MKGNILNDIAFFVISNILLDVIINDSSIYENYLI